MQTHGRSHDDPASHTFRWHPAREFLGIARCHRIQVRALMGLITCTWSYGVGYALTHVRHLRKLPLTRVGTRLPFEGGRDASDTSGAFEENEGLTGVLVAGGAAGVEGRLMTC